MPFEKGKPKTGGREVGTPNKAVKELRQQLQVIIETALEELPQTLANLEPLERAKVLAALLPYVMPKLSSVELKSEQLEDEPKRGKPDWLNTFN